MYTESLWQDNGGTMLLNVQNGRKQLVNINGDWVLNSLDNRE